MKQLSSEDWLLLGNGQAVMPERVNRIGESAGLGLSTVLSSFGIDSPEYGPAEAAQGSRYSAKTEKTGTKIRRAATGLPAARRAREPGIYKVSGSGGEKFNDGAAHANQPGKPQPQGAETARQPRTGATAWSPSGDATNSTVHV